MRVAFYGLDEITLKTAQNFIEEGHEVIIIDPDREKIEQISDKYDCSFLVGDASHPEMIKEIGPEETDIFFALSNHDQNNVIACLVARSLKVKRTILRVEDPDLEAVCLELGLRETVIPSETISQYLSDMIIHGYLLQFVNVVKNEARFFKIQASERKKEKLKILTCLPEHGPFAFFEKTNFIISKAAPTYKKEMRLSS